MTIKIKENQTYFDFAVDVPNITNMICDFIVTSQHSNDTLFGVKAYLIETNDRYSRFTCDIPSDTALNHWNGMHLYRLYLNETTYDTGSFKWVSSPGGETGTESYISNNETRQSKVIYRPNY